jgi:hypothetical protein
VLNIEQYRKIIPAQKLLESVRVALLPDGLKNLFSRQMHTRGMPTEFMEKDLMRVCVFSLLLKSAELRYKIIFPSFCREQVLFIYLFIIIFLLLFILCRPSRCAVIIGGIFITI